MLYSVTVPGEHIGAAKQDLERYYSPFGAEIQCKEIQTILQNHPELIEGLCEYGFDTYERELAVDLYLSDILKIEDSWPCNGDSDEYKEQFYDKLRQILLEKNRCLKN